MRTKLKLNLEELTVDSFDTSRPAPKEGTVFGEQCTCWTNCTCPGCPTCDHTACGQHTCGQQTCGGDTCDWSCELTCEWTCGQTALYTYCIADACW